MDGLPPRTRMQPPPGAEVGAEWKNRPGSPAAPLPTRRTRRAPKVGRAEVPTLTVKRGVLRRLIVPAATVAAATTIALGAIGSVYDHPFGAPTPPGVTATSPGTATPAPGTGTARPTVPPDAPGAFTPGTLPTSQPPEQGFIPTAGNTLRATFQVDKYMVSGGHENLNPNIGVIELTSVYPENKPQTMLYVCPDRTGSITVTGIDAHGNVSFTQGGKTSGFVFNVFSESFVQLLGGSPDGGGPSH